jgi:O-antigen ligase
MLWITSASVFFIIQPNIRMRIVEPIEGFSSKEGFDIKKGLDTKKPTWEMNTFQYRLYLWKKAINAFNNKPIAGYGIGSIKNILGIESHNDYLRLLVEGGLIGFFLYTSCFLLLLFSRIRAWVNTDDFRHKTLHSTTIALIISFLVIMIADNIITANTFLWYLFSVIAISCKSEDAASNTNVS